MNNTQFDRQETAYQEKKEQGPEYYNDIQVHDEALKHGFAQIPNIIIRDKRISDTSVRIYALLLSYSWQTKRCWPGKILLLGHM